MQSILIFSWFYRGSRAKVWRNKKYMRYINVHQVGHKYISYIIYKVWRDNSVIEVGEAPSKL